MRRLLVLAVALVALVATPSLASMHHWYLKESDYGRTLHVAVGDKISVRLPGGTSGGYRRPRSSNSTIAQRVWAAGGYPSADDARATFVARHRGKAELTATTDYPCLHTTPRCEIAQRIWIVYIAVA